MGTRRAAEGRVVMSAPARGVQYSEAHPPSQLLLLLLDLSALMLSAELVRERGGELKLLWKACASKIQQGRKRFSSFNVHAALSLELKISEGAEGKLRNGGGARGLS